MDGGMDGWMKVRMCVCMYDSWGGKTALSWAEAKIKSIDKEKMSKQHFQTDDEKRIVVGPAMIPDSISKSNEDIRRKQDI